jgi:hypothetical protein
MRPGICGAGGMLGPLRRHWNQFKKSRPGRRFQDFYDRKRGSRGGALWRGGAVVLGALLCLAGLFFMAVPGPGIPIFALGAVLIAQQSQATARLLDRAEMSLRRLVRSRGRG